ncbi:MAG: fimbria/pilus periplasmic chaperone [Sphaerochaetaceae bacterium]|jgi:fimbrial chaperone protein
MGMFSRDIRRIALVFLFLACMLFSVSAYQFSPLEQSFAPTGVESTKTYTIVNDSDDSIAITITALIRDQDENGQEVNQSAAKYFSIQPAKVIVKAQSSQIIRVQYRGPRTVTNELSFRIKAEQIAYNKGKQSTDKGMFNFLYNYVTSAYVAPAKVIEKISVTDVKRVTGTDGADQLSITVSNEGTVHQLLLNAILTINDSKGNSVVLDTKEQLGDLLGLNVLAKKSVTTAILMPAGLSQEKGTSYKASIKYSK